MIFAAILLPGSHKVLKVNSEGATEYLLKKRVEPGVWFFQSNGFYATAQRKADFDEKTKLFDYLNLARVGVLPVVKHSSWFCLPLNFNQYQKYVKAKVPLPLFFAPENISVFDPILTRVYKQRRTWLIFEDYNERYPTEQIERLRQMLEKWTPIEDGFPEELLNAFQVAKESTVPPLERLVRYSLKLAEATFESLNDLGSGRHRVNYSYKGHQTSVIINDNLTVLDAGICLNGQDRDFDLTSIVFVKAGKRSYDDDDY